MGESAVAGRSRVPDVRRRVVNDRPWRPGGAHVVYWMTSARRLDWNYGLERAVEIAREVRKPLVVLEALRADYPWASDRVHGFIMAGMREHQARLAAARVAYHPYVEPTPGAARGLLAMLAADAVGVVTDDYPAFILPRQLAAAARVLEVRLEAVDSNGLLPMRSADRAYPSAHAFRRFLHRALPDALAHPPAEHPLAGAPLAPALVPDAVRRRWPAASRAGLEGAALAALPVDHAVGPVAGAPGGPGAASARLAEWLEHGFARYADGRNQPLSGAASGLSPWLHAGHLSSWQVLRGVATREGWDPTRLGPPTGSRHGWWGMTANGEAYLDELVTWRELAFNNACHDPEGWDVWEGLPRWARETLDHHAADRRPWVYPRDALAGADTHDPLWNAAQRQLVGEGRIEGYLRMLWGKKILEWSREPQEALEVMVDLNNRFALDGRDPNSWSGILWCLGKYDRPWGPERAVFGKIRYMTSDSTRRKLKLDEYLKRWGQNIVS